MIDTRSANVQSQQRQEIKVQNVMAINWDSQVNDKSRAFFGLAFYEAD